MANKKYRRDLPFRAVRVGQTFYHLGHRCIKLSYTVLFKDRPKKKLPAPKYNYADLDVGRLRFTEPTTKVTVWVDDPKEPICPGLLPRSL